MGEKKAKPKQNQNGEREKWISFRIILSAIIAVAPVIAPTSDIILPIILSNYE